MKFFTPFVLLFAFSTQLSAQTPTTYYQGTLHGDEQGVFWIQHQPQQTLLMLDLPATQRDLHALANFAPQHDVWKSALILERSSVHGEVIMPPRVAHLEEKEHGTTAEGLRTLFEISPKREVPSLETLVLWITKGASAQEQREWRRKGWIIEFDDQQHLKLRQGENRWTFKVHFAKTQSTPLSCGRPS